ncbi:acyltransferase [Gammaproteobacteria bacterium]|nr:acyltransferase [Gammaproteobacteria bacterium]
MKYRAEIDGLRALAVLPVILFHAGFEWFSGGFVGVDVFFVISGYLITTIIISEMAEGKFSIVNFYERRARRILPALFFVMAACLPFAWLWLEPNGLKDFGKSLVAVSTFSSNILFWRESGYFDAAAELKPLLHTWSLAVEEQYYILFPIFLMFTWRLGIKWVLILLSVVFFISLGVAQWGAYNKPIASFFLLPTRGWELLIGVFAAFYLKYNTHLKSHILNQVLSLLGFGMIIYSVVEFDKTTPFPSLYALIPTIGTGLLILCAVPKTLVYKLLSLKFIVGTGLISYSAYLWHQPLLAFARHRSFGEISELILITLCVMSLVMAWFSWKFVEKPFRSKTKVNSRSIFKFSTIFTLFFLITGLWLHQSNGALKYYPKEKQQVLGSFIDDTTDVLKKYGQIRLLEFSKTNQKQDILIIGDSHSVDLVNAVFEADLDNNKEFSSFDIPWRCGVLFVRDKKDREEKNLYCHKEEFSFFNNNLQMQMSLADEIWIISAWRESDVRYMTESVKNIKAINKNIKLFGTKHFGSPSHQWYLNTNINNWSSAVFEDGDESQYSAITKINNNLNNIADSLNVEFINTQHLICKGYDSCSNYVEGNIISYDGSHLTKHGAKILGESLKAALNKTSSAED